MTKKIALLFTFVLYLTFANHGAFAAQSNDCNTTRIDYTPYAEYLQNKIVTKWNPETNKKHQDVVVLVKFDKDGILGDIKIQKSSNNKKFDNEVVDSILRSVPFDSLPKDCPTAYKNVQMSFVYNKTDDKKAPQKFVIADISDLNGYDQFIQQFDKTLADNVTDKSYFTKKDSVFEMNIDKSGKLLYVKALKSNLKDDFIKKEFERKTVLTLQKASYPSIPDEMGANEFTVDYRVVTRRGRLFKDYVVDYALNFFRTGAEAYCIQNPCNL